MPPACDSSMAKLKLMSVLCISTVEEATAKGQCYIHFPSNVPRSLHCGVQQIRAPRPSITDRTWNLHEQKSVSLFIYPKDPFRHNIRRNSYKYTTCAETRKGRSILPFRNTTQQYNEYWHDQTIRAIKARWHTAWLWLVFFVKEKKSRDLKKSGNPIKQGHYLARHSIY